MKKLLIKTLSIVLSIVLIFSIGYLLSLRTSIVWQNNKFNAEIPSDKFTDGYTVTENENYKMVWVSSNCSVALVDKNTGIRYCTTPTKEGEPQFDELGMPIKKHPQLESAVIIEYVNNKNDLEEQSLSYTAAVSNGRVVASNIENGVIVDYYFDEAEIMVPVKYILRKDSLNVSVVTKDIQENDNLLTAVSLLPFMCSVGNEMNDSYLLYPSGSGTLIYPKKISETGVIYSSSVYGNDPVMEAEDKITTENSIRIPVFGSKTGNYGVCGIIENTSEAASIVANVGSTSIKYSGVYAKFQVRGYCSSTTRFMIGGYKTFNVYSKSMIDAEMSIGFYPLNGEEASYSRMANLYKNYLKKTYELARVDNESALNLTFIGGTMVDKSFLGIPYDDLFVTTSIKDVQKTLKEIVSQTEASINCRLIGFGNSGIDNKTFAGGFKLNKEFGSLDDLNELNEYCSKNNISLFYDFDLISLKKNSGGYNRYFDVAFNALDKIANVYEYNAATRSRIEDTTYNLLSRELLKDASQKLLKSVEDWNIGGVSLRTLSNTAYSDYSVDDTVKYYSQMNMGEDITEIFKELKTKYDIAGEDANSYAAILSDVVFNTPTRSSMEQIFDDDIPFYQQVFKGYVQMSSQPINISSTPEKERLKAIECGISLDYLLINNFENELIDYNGYEFFGSKYSSVKADIFDSYNNTKEYYYAINNSEITSHEIISDNLRKTVFSNGTIVIVNYGDMEEKTELGIVQPNGFVWRGE